MKNKCTVENLSRYFSPFFPQNRGELEGEIEKGGGYIPPRSFRTGGEIERGECLSPPLPLSPPSL
jgi:hypothetical protein